MCNGRPLCGSCTNNGSDQSGTAIAHPSGPSPEEKRACHQELVEALGNNALTYRIVARWVVAFQRERQATRHMKWSRRPVGVRTDVSRAVLEYLSENEKRRTLREL